MKKKKVLLALIPLAALAVAIPAMRNPMLSWALEKSTHKLAQRFGIQASFQDPTWTDWKTVGFARITLEQPPNGMAITAEFPEAEISIGSLLGGNMKVNSLTWQACELDYFPTENTLESDVNPVSDPLGKIVQVVGLMEEISESLPHSMELRNNKVSWMAGSELVDLYAKEVLLQDGWLRGQLLMEEKIHPGAQGLIFSGSFDPVNWEAEMLVSSLLEDGFLLPLPGENRELGLAAGHLRMGKEDTDQEGQRLQGSYSLAGLFVKDPALTEAGWMIPSISGEFRLISDETALVASMLTDVNDMVSAQRISLDRIAGEGILELELPLQAADLYIKAMPESMSSLEGLRLAGKLGGNFSLKFDALGRIEVDGQLQDTALAVMDWGPADLRILKGKFSHLPWREDKLIRVGEDGMDFVPLSQVPEPFLSCLILSEDANFYAHQGFDCQAIGFAVRENMTQRRFARGGSTLSMQLTRNVFLTSQKNLERKLEEIILTGLMERTEVISKHRIAEIYLNVIEWGEGVYGLRQASRHYFGKEPATLDLNEILFLCGIVPNPRKFTSFFEGPGKLSEFGESYFSGMAYLLHKSGVISEEDLDRIASPRLLPHVLDWDGPMGSEAMGGTI